MAYLVQGNALELSKAFGQEWMTIESSDTCMDPELMERELSQTRFLGTENQALYFLETWKAHVKGAYYLPGNMSASNLFCLTGMSQPFLKATESPEEYQENNVHLHFAYVNEMEELCGLMLMYRKDEPARWMLGLMKNGHLAPQDRIVIFLSSFDLDPYLMIEEQKINVSSVSPSQDFLREQINSPIIHALLHNIFKMNHGVIDKNSARLMHLLRLLQGTNQTTPAIDDPIDFTKINSQLLFEENFVLHLIGEHSLQLSSAMLNESLTTDSGLQKEIKNIRFVDDECINKNLLQMVILFHEHQVLEQNRDFLQNHVFAKTRSGLLWNSTQINLIPYLLKHQFDLELFHLILAEEAYYSAVQILVQFGYDDDIPLFLADSDKRKELEYIHSLESIHARKLCLIFFAKGEFTLKDYTRIVKETIDFPMLAETLVALDQKDLIPIKSFKALAFKPEQHQLQSLLHHFSKEMNQAGLKKADLKKLKITELSDLIKSFSVLKNSGITDGGSYNLVLNLNNKKQGQLLRLFLPSLGKIDNIIYRRELINILYIGITQSTDAQSKAIKRITDQSLVALATNVHERFLCAKQMQDLDFEKDIIELAAEEWGIKGIRFRKVILKVEEQCKIIHERLRESMVDQEKAKLWQNADKNYRRMLYHIAYDGLMKPEIDLQPRIDQIEEEILNIVDPEIKSLFYNALIIIANILITLFTLSIANNIKEKRTGNFWFFNQTPMGEKVRALNKDVMNVITSPEPEPSLSP